MASTPNSTRRPSGLSLDLLRTSTLSSPRSQEDSNTGALATIRFAGENNNGVRAYLALSSPHSVSRSSSQYSPTRSDRDYPHSARNGTLSAENREIETFIINNEICAYLQLGPEEEFSGNDDSIGDDTHFVVPQPPPHTPSSSLSNFDSGSCSPRDITTPAPYADASTQTSDIPPSTDTHAANPETTVTDHSPTITIRPRTKTDESDTESLLFTDDSIGDDTHFVVPSPPPNTPISSLSNFDSGSCSPRDITTPAPYADASTQTSDIPPSTDTHAANPETTVTDHSPTITIRPRTKTDESDTESLLFTEDSSVTDVEGDYAMQGVIDSSSRFELIDDNYLYDQVTGGLYLVVIKGRKPLKGEEKAQALTKLAKATSDALETSDSYIPYLMRKDIRMIMFSPDTESIYCLTSSGLPIRLPSVETKRILTPEAEVNPSKKSSKFPGGHSGLSPATNEALSIISHEKELYLEAIEKAITWTRATGRKRLTQSLTLLRDLTAITGHSYSQEFSKQQGQQINALWRNLVTANPKTLQSTPDAVEDWISIAIDNVIGTNIYRPIAMVSTLAKTLCAGNHVDPQWREAIEVKHPEENECDLSSLLSDAIADVRPKQLLNVYDFYKPPDLTVENIFGKTQEKVVNLLSMNHLPNAKGLKAEKPAMNNCVHFHLKRANPFSIELQPTVQLKNPWATGKKTADNHYTEDFELLAINCTVATNDSKKNLSFHKVKTLEKEQWYQSLDGATNECQWSEIQGYLRGSPHNSLLAESFTLSPIDHEAVQQSPEDTFPPKDLLASNDTVELNSFRKALNEKFIADLPPHEANQTMPEHVEAHTFRDVDNTLEVISSNGRQPLLLSNHNLQEIANASHRLIRLFHTDTINQDTGLSDCQEIEFRPKNGQLSDEFVQLEPINLLRQTSAHPAERHRAFILKNRVVSQFDKNMS